ncbi:MAG: flagellar hook-associated protein FlgK [Alphaproteobacteria bacterium]|nr:flagellar hook-associated protein FlgK [Alphaproteobacteria bacterium]
MTLIAGIQTSISGMKASQAQLDVVARNITNSNTAGYTRKYYNQSSTVLAGNGSGVSLSSLQRTVDESLLRSYLSSNSSYGNASVSQTYLSNLESYIGSPTGNNSIATDVTNVSTTLENLAADVTSAATRYDLTTYAQSLTKRLQSISTEIQNLRTDADQEIATSVKSINSLLDTISDLNTNIVKYTALGYDGVVDLEDKRDTALKELSGYMNISYYTRESGEIVIQASDGTTLLDKEPHYLSHTAISQSSSLTSVNGGGIQGIYIDGKDITSSISNGSLKGLIDIRDTTLPSFQSQLDELAGVMIEQVNIEHNKGTSYPTLNYSKTGTTTFIDSSVQSIQIDNGDVRFTIFDKSGNQVATTTLGQDLGFTSGTIDDMATALESWLQSPSGGNLSGAEVSVNADGKLIVDTGDSEYGLSIMDVSDSKLGATQSSVNVKFDADGDGTYDKTVEGFSNFFGLNDFFVKSGDDSVYDSKVLSKSANLGLSSPATLTFSDETNGIGYASLTIQPGTTVQGIVDKINNDPVLSENLKASLVQSGNGYILRIVNSNGDQMEITETSSTNLMSRLGLEVSNAQSASQMVVNEDLLATPGLIAVGAPEYEESSGTYKLSASSNSIANKLADVFTSSSAFSQAGSVSAMNTSFSSYASNFVGVVASTTNAATENSTYQSELLSSIETKYAQVSSVDVDEELSNMIIFKQTYNACAQAFTANKEIIDTLLSMV